MTNPKSSTSKRYKLRNIVECVAELERLSKARGKKRTKYIDEAKSCVINAISEIAKNCLCGNIPLETCDFAKLKRYQGVLRTISKKKISVKKRKEQINQSGGFLPFLIPPALSLIAGLVGDQLRKRL